MTKWPDSMHACWPGWGLEMLISDLELEEMLKGLSKTAWPLTAMPVERCMCSRCYPGTYCVGREEPNALTACLYDGKNIYQALSKLSRL